MIPHLCFGLHADSCVHLLWPSHLIVSGTPLNIISLATQRAEMPAYHCNVCGMVAAGDGGFWVRRLGFWVLAAFINLEVR